MLPWKVSNELLMAIGPLTMDCSVLQVLMATNRIDILDPALLRPGRIDRKIEFPNPSESSRFDILKIHSRKMNLMRGINLKKVADKMTGASGDFLLYANVSLQAIVLQHKTLIV